MPKYLVVVESPAKARTINKFLGSNYVVRASYGHIRDLPKSKLGVDLEDDFKPSYVNLRDSLKHIKALREAVKNVDAVYLASDPDREGEAIGWHVAEVLKKADKPFKRIEFNAITKRNVKEAVKNPRPIDMNLVNAQQARRVLDRIVGYKLSPLLQWGIRKGLSAGRVQSPALAMVCDREAEIRAFVIEEYWTLDAQLKTEKDESFVARLTHVDGKKLDKLELGAETEVKKLIDNLSNVSYSVDDVERKEVRRRPYPPFITSSLQQDASRKLGLTPRNTMRIAQQLYEGLPLGSEGQVGLITYMRTDSTRIEPEALDDARSYIKQNFEAAMLPEKPNFYKSKKGAQDAHEAIRPTTAQHTPESVKPFLNDDQLKLYTLIWKRFVASQMTPAVFDQTAVNVAAGNCRLRATGSIMKFAGFTKLYEEASDDKKNGKLETEILPDVKKGDGLSLDKLIPEQHFTKPPARFTEALLIRAMEEVGLGRPSTYAPTINIIQERGYVEREKGRLKPTELGEQVNDLLQKHFHDIVDLNFTAGLEEDLDKVEAGKTEWHELLREFYTKFMADLKSAQNEMVKELVGDTSDCENCGSPMEVRESWYGLFVACKNYPECKTVRKSKRQNAVEETDEVCDKCNSPMVIRAGRYGKFMACSTYPKCKNTFNIDKDGKKVDAPPKEPPKKTDQKCPDCNAFLLIRKSRAGEEFYGCEKYPKCKFTKPMELNLKCPASGCDGELVTKRAKRRRFTGCDKYPKCEFTVFGKIDKDTACPKCGNSWTATAKPRGKPKTRSCPISSCDYSEELPEE